MIPIHTTASLWTTDIYIVHRSTAYIAYLDLTSNHIDLKIYSFQGQAPWSDLGSSALLVSVVIEHDSDLNNAPVSGSQLLGNEPGTFALPELNFNHKATATLLSVFQCTQIKLLVKQSKGLSFQQQQHLMRCTWIRILKVRPIHPCQHLTTMTPQPIKLSELAVGPWSVITMHD